MLPSGSREGGLGVPGTTSGRRRAPSVCSEDDFGPSGDDFGGTLKQKFSFWENFGDENLLRWKIFDHVLVPNERSGSLYLNHHYDFRFGVAMCFEKRFGVEREEASSEITLTLVAIETL